MTHPVAMLAQALARRLLASSCPTVYRQSFAVPNTMGSSGDTWLQCTWCWRWGRCVGHDSLLHGAWPLIDIDAIGLLCEFCDELDEPPWQPNNRQRYEQHMLLGCVLPPAVRIVEVARMLALCLAPNTP